MDCSNTDQGNYGSYIPSKTDVETALESLPGECYEASFERKAVRDCIAKTGTPLVYVTFSLPPPSTEHDSTHSCSVWIKSAEHMGRRWIVADSLIDLAQPPIRKRTVYEVKKDGPSVFFRSKDSGGYQMLLCQAPPSIRKGIVPGEQWLPPKLVVFFLCDPWQ